MVIPLPSGMGGDMSGAAPESAEPLLTKVKWTVLVVMGMYVVKILMLYLGDVFSDLFYIISGLFLLKDDPHTGRFYKILMGSPCASCAGPSGGGLTCLFPLMMMGGINILFGFMRLNPLTMVSLGAQGVGVYYAYKVYKAVQGAHEGGAQPAFAGGSSGPSTISDAREMDTPSGPPTKNSASTHFVPFQGEGNKLGSV